MNNIVIKSIKLYSNNTETFRDGGKKYRSVFNDDEGIIYADIALANRRHPHGEARENVYCLLCSEDGRCIDKQIIDVVMNGDSREMTLTVCFTTDELEPCDDVETGRYHVRAAVGGQDRKADLTVAHLPERVSSCFELKNFTLSHGKGGDEDDREQKIEPNRTFTQSVFAFDHQMMIDAHFVAENKLPRTYPGWPDVAEFIVSVYDYTGSLQERFACFGKLIDENGWYIGFTARLCYKQPACWRRGKYRIEASFMDKVIAETAFAVGNKDVTVPFRMEDVYPRPFRESGKKPVVSTDSFVPKGYDDLDKFVADSSFEENDEETEEEDSIGIEGVGFFCDAEAQAWEEKWRSVFRTDEAQNINMDITLVNKNYPAKGWKGDVRCRLYKYEGEQELPAGEQQTIAVQMEKTDAELTITNSYSGISAGKYYVTADVAGKGNGSRSPDFHIIDIPEDYGMCFELESFTFYRRNEGEEQTDYKKNTLTAFNSDKLVVIDAFFLAKSKLSFEWPAEFCVSLFDRRGMLIQQRSWHKGAPIEGGEKEQFHFLVNFGNGQQSFWRKGDYRVEVLFMGEIIIEAPFSIGDKDVETPFSEVSVQPRRLHGGKQVISAATMNIDAMAQINGMIGLGQLKRELKRYTDKVLYNEARQRAGLLVKPTALHSVYLGNPGTGKTTIAKLMGKVFHELGLLSKGHVVVEERNSLTGKFYGSEEEKTNQALERAKGGVLFIDEAYTLLVKDDPKDPGRRIMETLLTTMSDESQRDICIIFAGYPNPMINMLNENPGMKSRVPNVYHFDDYSVDELMQIADLYMKTNQYVMTAEALEALRLMVEKAYGKRDGKFGNGRYIINLLEIRIIPNLASRLIATGDINRAECINVIQQQDVDNPETEVKDADYFKTKRHPLGFTSKTNSHS